MKRNNVKKHERKKLYIFKLTEWNIVERRQCVLNSLSSNNKILITKGNKRNIEIILYRNKYIINTGND